LSALPSIRTFRRNPIPSLAKYVYNNSKLRHTKKDIKNIHKIQEDIFGQFQILVGPGDKKFPKHEENPTKILQLI